MADTLQTAGDLVPGSRKAIDRRLGRKRASALLTLALNAWRKPAGVARAHAHASGTTTTTFGSEADGTAGKVSYGVRGGSAATSSGSRPTVTPRSRSRRTA